MNTNLLYVPFRATEDVDLGNELRQVITRHYFQAPSSFTSDLNRASDLRHVVARLSDGKVSALAITLVGEYLHLLKTLLKKFPDDCVEFRWALTIGHGRHALEPVPLIHSEQWQVTWQLGAIYSQLALLEPRHTDAGLKNACNYFKLALGTYQYLLGLRLLLNPEQIPRDCDSHTLECLQTMMVAQAQETIWQKGLADGMKDSLIARLSIQASEYYEKAVAAGTELPYIILEWLNHLRVKQHHFKAAAHFRMATVSLAAHQYGAQVGHLKVAAAACNQAARHKRYVHDFVLEDLAGLTSAISDLLRLAEKENDLIYLQVVPLEQELKPIGGVNMVAAEVPAVLTLPSSAPEAFAELLPYILLQVAQAFRERQDDFVNTEIAAPLHALDQQLVRFLNERNLPASLDAIQQPENLPHSLLQHARDIQLAGGTAFLEKKLQELSQAGLRLQQLLQECQARLDLDHKEDQMLTQYFKQPVREPTHVAAADILKKLALLQQYFDQARAGDGQLSQTYIAQKMDIEAYTSPPEVLARMIPNSKYVALDGQLTVAIDELRRLVSKSDDLRKAREQLLESVEIRGRDNNILPKLIGYYKGDKAGVYNVDGSFNERVFEPIYEEHVRMFNPDLHLVQELKAEQQQLEQDIAVAQTAFEKQWQSREDETQAKRKNVLQHFETVYSNYKELVGHMEDGIKFYHDFLTKGTAVVKECENFLERRRTEAQEMEARDERASRGVWNPNSTIEFE